MDADARKELLERYKLAYAEYRAEVALGWDRQKLFLTVNPALTAYISSSSQAHSNGARLALVVAAATAIAGTMIVRRSHGRYQATRKALQAIEDRLGIQDLQTTGGQRTARSLPSGERFKVVHVVSALLLLTAALNLVLAATR